LRKRLKRKWTIANFRYRKTLGPLGVTRLKKKKHLEAGGAGVSSIQSTNSTRVEQSAGKGRLKKQTEKGTVMG